MRTSPELFGDRTGGSGSLCDSTVSDNPVRVDVIAGLLAAEEVGDGLAIRRIWAGLPTRTIS